jgi:hypothetical protein
MRSSRLLQVIGAAGAIFLTSFGTSAQTENPPSVKGRWGLSTGLNLDRYKTDIGLFQSNKTLGILPMVTYTRGKNQFELGPQFSLANSNTRQNHKYFGINFQYKRYFNGFGTSFVPYLFSGIGFSTTSSNTVREVGQGIVVANYPYNYKQTGVNLSIGYGLEWQIGKSFYLGSSVSLNPGFYSIHRSDFMPHSFLVLQQAKQNETVMKFDFNVNMQFGYRFGRK